MAAPAGEISKKRKEPASITEVIAKGADVVIARPLLMMVPILLDLYYLVGWRIVPGTTFDRLQTAATDLKTSEGTQLAGYIEIAARSDVTGLISFVIPSFLVGSTSNDLYRPMTRSLLSADNWGALMFAVVILIGISMVLFGVFGLWLADTGLNRPRSWTERLRLGPVIGGRFVLTILLMIAMVLLLCIPLFLAMVVATFLGLGFEGLVLTVSVLTGFALYVLFYFAPDALLVDLVGPVQALRRSSAVVRNNLLLTLGFAAVSVILSIGVAAFFDRIATSIPGMAIAIIGNAFIGCVLWIASLLFFSERSKLLAPQRAVVGTTRSTK